MVQVISRRPGMTLYSDPQCAQSHRTRIVLAEKDIIVEIIDVDPDDKPQELLDINPYHSVPTLIDRQLVLYDARVIMEYLDERFPHPPLMPVDPVSRSKSRLAMFHLERDWYAPLQELQELRFGAKREAPAATKKLQESLRASAELFKANTYFLSDEFTLVDCSIAPFLWRLPALGVKMNKPIMQYARRVFGRASFKGSLSEEEIRMWPDDSPP